jgi:hypothetical protein
MGFGKRIQHNNPKARDRYYGEWEVGTYESAWRVIRSGKIICASHDASDSNTPENPPDIDRTFRRINFGRLLSIQKINKWDFELKFDFDLSINLFGASSDKDDEFFHIFFPENKCLVFESGEGWFYGDSDKPW